jgi:hypothetical protein
VTTDEMLTLAASLAAAAQQPPPKALHRLSGGRNNRAFLITTEAESLVLKLYHADSRDRLGAEFAFLTCAWQRGLRDIPQPLARDPARHAALYSFVPGTRLRPEEVAPWHVEAALDFVLALNAAGNAPLGPGAEACFTAGEHIATIARRLARVDTIEPTDPASTAAATFVATRLRPAWTQVHTRLVAHLHQAGIALEAPTASCLSPSDFGFHNALVDGQRIGFLDFEYAGRDDPAKLVCDFFAQPELPAPAALFNTFVARLVAGLGLNDQDAARCHALRAAYRVKWACILLNEFLPRDAARREFATEAPVAARRASQLERAAAQLTAIDTEGE